MNLIDQIRIAQRNAGEAEVVRHLNQLGLGAVGNYASAQESATVIIKPTDREKWLDDALDQIAPHRYEMGSAGDTDALIKLAKQLHQKNEQLQTVNVQLRGEAGVMRTLLDECLKVISTLEPEDDHERDRINSLTRVVQAIVAAAYTVPR